MNGQRRGSVDRLGAAAGYGIALSVPILIALQPLPGDIGRSTRILVLVGSMLLAMVVAGFTLPRSRRSAVTVDSVETQLALATGEQLRIAAPRSPVTGEQKPAVVQREAVSVG